MTEKDNVYVAERTPQSDDERREVQLDDALHNFNDIPTPTKPKISWWTMALLVVAIALGLYFMVKLANEANEGDLTSLADIVAHMNWAYFSCVIALVLLLVVVDSLRYHVITNVVTGSANYLTSLKVALLGKYYDNVTPFASGGQPMQILYLHGKNYSTGKASAITFIKYVASMLSWIIVAGLLMALNAGALYTNVTDVTQRELLQIFGWIGLAANTLAPVSVALLALLPKVTGAVLRFFINIGAKIKLVKNPDDLVNKAYKAVNDFKSGFVVMSRRPAQFVLLMLLCVIEPLVTAVLPYVTLLAFSGNMQLDVNVVITVMTLYMYANMSSAIIPTPGNSGVAEVALTLAIGTLMGTLSLWVMIAFRFFTFYMYVIIGIIISVFEFIRNIQRSKQ